MHRIMLVMAYDGAAYHGWQTQNEDNSIQEEIEKAIKSLTLKRSGVISASRTDSGVHAEGNVCVFDTDSRIPTERFVPGLNRFLPYDIRIVKAIDVEDDFNPRHEPHTKIYEYRINNERVLDPLLRHYCLHFHKKLDIGAMREAANYLKGKHDFKSFVNPESQVFEHGGDAVRTIYKLDIDCYNKGIKVPSDAEYNEFNELRIRFSGDGFLYHMIRIIVGTLLWVGTGKLMPSDIPLILEKKDRRAAGQTVPAKGLRLVRLIY